MTGVGGEVNWQKLAGKLPTGKDEKAKAARTGLFTIMDPNGNGYLSLAEIDRGLRQVMGEKDAGGYTDVDSLSPAIARAFHAAKNAVESKASLGEDFVERKEFRLLLVYLKRYFELFGMFLDIDTSDDRRMD